ncbi:MAG: YdcF family protein [Acidobacteria bacterium]|nr:YdcF family protein [Acidobacteriota bacterium]
MLLLLLLTGLYFLTPIILNKLAFGLIRRDPVDKADLIVALGGDARCNRERRAVELYRQGLGSRVVVSGIQYAWGFHSADAAKRYVVSLGVPESDVLAIRESTNTRSEARILRRMMQENGWKTAIIVTSPYHSRRAMYTFEKINPDYRFISSPYEPMAGDWQPERWWAHRMYVGLTVKEIAAWANTVAGGWE